MFKTIFETAAKPLENAKTKAFVKAREKSQTTWRELVELSLRDKAQPEEWILQRVGVDMGIPTDQALSLFKADVKAFGEVKQAVKGQARAEDRVQGYLDAWDVTNDSGFRAKRKLKYEELKRELNEMQQEDKLYLRDVGIVATHKAALIRNKNNTRLFPNGIDLEERETPDA